MNAAPPASALVVRLSSIGDVIHTLPAYMALRRAWPSTLLGWAVEPAAAALVQRLPGPLMVHILDLPRWRRQWWAGGAIGELRGALAALRQPRYDLALDFQGLLKSAIVGRLSGAPVLGYHRSDLREPIAARLYTSSAAAAPGDQHVIWRAMGLTAAAGADDQTVSFPRLSDADDEAYVVAELQRLGVDRFTLMHAVSNWSSKKWPASRYVAVGQALRRRTGLPVLWIWGPGERGRTAALARGAGLGNHLAFPSTLTQLAALLRRADLFVGGDSAPLHLAVACGTPTVGLFGPTDPTRNGPLRAEDTAVIQRLPCSFCYRRRCPIGTGQCLQDVSADAVVEAALRRLDAAGER